MLKICWAKSLLFEVVRVGHGEPHFQASKSGWEKFGALLAELFMKYDLLVCQLDGGWELSETRPFHPLYFFYFSFPFLLLGCCAGCSPVPHAVLLLSPSAGQLPAQLICWVSLGFDVIVQVPFFCSALFSSLCVLRSEILISGYHAFHSDGYHAFHSDCSAAISLLS